MEVGLARQGRRGAADRIEREGKAFLERVREGYLTLARADERAELLEATGEPEAVQARIREALIRRFPETMPRRAV